jgi:hypothetical protein
MFVLSGLFWASLIVFWPSTAAMAEPGKWDHHSRTKVGRQQQGRSASNATTLRPPPPPMTSTTTTASTTTTTRTTTAPTTVVALQPDRRHWAAVTAPAHRCQVPDEAELPDGRSLNMDYVMGVPELLLEDKLLLAPIVFEGAMVSRTNTYKGLYFVSFKVLRVLKGRIHRQQLAGQVRLLFQTLPATSTPVSAADSYNSSSLAAGGHQRPAGLRGNACPPVPFNVRTGRKYLIFVRKLALGRYVAVAEPELVRKKTRKAVRRTFCPGCGEYCCVCIYVCIQYYTSG